MPPHTQTGKAHARDTIPLSLPDDLLALARRLAHTDARLNEAITQMLEEPELLER